MPTLTDYLTGAPIRPATREEWQRSKDAAINEPGGTGAFDLDGRSVYVDGDFPTSAPTAHTPEPWVVDWQGPDHPIYAGEVCVATAWCGEADANAARIVAAVNACAGIDDPGRALAEVRDTMRGVLTMLEDYADGRNPASNDYIACQNLRDALALLGEK